MPTDQRTRTRVPVRFEVAVIARGHKVDVETWDLSLRGMKCGAHKLFQVNDPCDVMFILGPHVRFKVSGTVVRATPREAAIYFSSMDEESFYHLKKIIQYNTDDPDKIDSELSQPPRTS